MSLPVSCGACSQFVKVSVLLLKYGFQVLFTPLQKGKQTSVKGAAVHVFSGPGTEIDKLNRDREIYIVLCCR